MKIRKVSADLLDRPATTGRATSPRERRRLALESVLESAIRRANEDAQTAFLVELQEGEKPATVRLAFNRVREREGAPDVNLFSRQGALIVAKRAQTRGRRSK